MIGLCNFHINKFPRNREMWNISNKDATEVDKIEEFVMKIIGNINLRSEAKEFV